MMAEELMAFWIVLVQVKLGRKVVFNVVPAVLMAKLILKQWHSRYL